MAVTSFAPMDIGSGLADGISMGGQYLAKAISMIGENYAQAKAADSTMNFLSQMKDSNNQPLVSSDEMEAFAKGSLGSKNQMLGVMLQKATLGWQLQNQQALQRSGGQVEQQTHAANTNTDYNVAAQHGLVAPNKGPGNNPAGNLKTNNNNTPTTQDPSGSPVVEITGPGGKPMRVIYNQPGNPKSGISHYTDANGNWQAAPSTLP